MKTKQTGRQKQAIDDLSGAPDWYDIKFLGY